MKNTKALIGNLAIPLVVGGVSALLTNSSMEQYGKLNQPPLSPPSILFPIVWTILFVLMGISAYMVVVSNDMDKEKALWIYGIQLAFNFLWSIFFFLLEWRLLAFLSLIHISEPTRRS